MLHFNRYDFTDSNTRMRVRSLCNWLLETAPQLNLLLLPVTVTLEKEQTSYKEKHKRIREAIKEALTELSGEEPNCLGDFIYSWNQGTIKALSITIGQSVPASFNRQARQYMKEALQQTDEQVSRMEMPLLRACFALHALAPFIREHNDMEGYGLLDARDNKFVFQPDAITSPRQLLSFQIDKHPHRSESVNFRIYQPKLRYQNPEADTLFRGSGITIYDSQNLKKIKTFDRLEYVNFRAATPATMSDPDKKEKAVNAIMQSKVANEVYWQAKFEVFLNDAGIGFTFAPFEPALRFGALKKHRLKPGVPAIDPNLIGIDALSLCDDGVFPITYGVDSNLTLTDDESEQLDREIQGACAAINEKSTIQFKVQRAPKTAGVEGNDLFISNPPDDGERWVSTPKPSTFTDTFGRYKISQLQQGLMPTTQGLSIEQALKGSPATYRRIFIEIIMKRWLDSDKLSERDLDVDAPAPEKETTFSVLSIQRYNAYEYQGKKRKVTGTNLIGAIYAGKIHDAKMEITATTPFVANNTKGIDTLPLVTAKLLSLPTNHRLTQNPATNRIDTWANTILSTESAINTYACHTQSLMLFEHQGDTLLRVWALENGKESLSPPLKAKANIEVPYPELCRQWLEGDNFSKKLGEGSLSLVSHFIRGAKDPEYTVAFEGPRVFINRAIYNSNSSHYRILMTVFRLLYNKNNGECTATPENSKTIISGTVSDELGVRENSGVKQTIFEKVAKLSTTD